MKFAFCADGEYQLLNCVNFVWHNVEGSKGNSDLYINLELVANKFPNLMTLLRKEELFQNIYLYKNPHVAVRKKQILYYLVRSIELFFPSIALRKYVKDHMKRKNYYSVILSSSFTPVFLALADMNKMAHIWALDDGVGSYYGNGLTDMPSKLAHILYKFAKKGRDSIHIERMYVNNKAMCQSKIQANFKQLPKIDSNDHALIDFFTTLFETGKVSKLKGKKYIFLTQPLEEIFPASVGEEGKKMTLDILHYLEMRYKEEIIIRKHRRDFENYFKGLEIDESNILWELFCMTSLSEDQYLIGVFSSAQLMPKLLFNKEPYVIFLFELVKSCLQAERKAKFNDFVEEIRSNYTDKSKIQIPKTFQEFVDIIEKSSIYGGKSW